MKFILICFFLSLQIVFGQENITLTKLTRSELPKGISYKENLKEAVRWIVWKANIRAKWY